MTHFKQQLWAICSHCSLKKSGHERSALVALYKRVTAYRSRRSLKKSNMSDSLVIWENCLQKMSDSLDFLHFLTVLSGLFKEQIDRIAHDALYKRATMSDSLRLLLKKERIHSFFWANCSFAHKKRVIPSKNRFIRSKIFDKRTHQLCRAQID